MAHTWGPQSLQVGSRRPTLRRAPRGASFTYTNSNSTRGEQAGWVGQAGIGPPGTQAQVAANGVLAGHSLHPREPLYPIALSFYDAMNVVCVGGTF